MLLVTDNDSLIQSLVLGGTIFLIFVAIGILLLRRNRNRLSISLALYFISVAIGLMVNFTYRLLELLGVMNFTNHIQIFSTLQILTIYFTTFAGIFLLNFNLILYYSTRTFGKKRQNTLTLLYAIVLLGMFVTAFIFGPDEFGDVIKGVTWDPNTNDPIWNLYMGGYFLIVSQLVFIFIIYYAIKISKKMGKNKYSKKYLRNIIGILFFDVQLIGAFLAFTFGLRNVGFIIQAVAILPGAFLLASGLKKEPETE
ncbi:MAG: hypothetical protein ACTSRK_03030 [Promethearchaeota archaeon]